MKRLLCVILACLMLLCACTPGDNTSIPQNESEASSTEDASSSVSADESKTEDTVMKDYPVVTGTFVQLWAFSGYSVTQWENHFKKLLEVGIDTVIVQWTATTPYGEFKDCYYNTALAEDNKTADYVCYSSCIYRMFEAAGTTGVKIFLGLNISDEWWNYTSLTTEWGVKQADIGIKIAQELYDKYYGEYTESFAGWYWPWELYNHMSTSMAQTAAQFINLYLDGLTAIDPSLPLMLSPFLSESATPEATEQVWNTFFATASFRAGDIFCSQDSVGAGYMPIEKLESYFAAMKNAIDNEEGLIFWANNENFNSDYTSADISRFIQQMKITDTYVSGHVTFAYSHYYHPDKYPALHQKYKTYYETGVTE